MYNVQTHNDVAFTLISFDPNNKETGRCMTMAVPWAKCDFNFFPWPNTVCHGQQMRIFSFMFFSCYI